jgi:hypothetical protein
MKKKQLEAKITTHPTIGDYLLLDVKNTETSEVFVYDERSDTVKVRISLDSALQIAQLIDDYYDELMENKMKVGV